MLRILLLLVVGSCLASAERPKVSIVTLPENVKDSEVNATAPAGSRIIGGTPAPIERWGYAVQIMYSNQLACGGSVLTIRHVLSAAHCFVNNQGVLLSANLFTCRVGTATLNTGGHLHNVSMILNHERYNRDAPRDHDISVLLLRTDIQFTPSVYAAAIPNQGAGVQDNVGLWVIGWGRTNAAVAAPSPILNEAGVFSINNVICAQRYRNLELINNLPYPVTTNMLCSGILDFGGRDACQGDSGGPVISGVNSRLVVGITSWGEGCAHPYYPGVNARVSAYTNWINQTVTRYNGAPSIGQTSATLLILSFLVSAVFSKSL